MKKVHTEEQIVGILRGHEASGLSVKEFCRSKGIHAGDVLQLKKGDMGRWMSRKRGN